MLKNLNARERRLAGALAVIGFLLLNLIFLPKLIAFNRAGHQKSAELRAQVAAAEGWIAKRDYWNERKDWLEKAEPPLTAAREDSSAQLELLQTTARGFGLSILDIELLQLPPNAFYHAVGAKLTVKGPWEGLVRFVSGLQEPTLFDVIPHFSVKSADPPPNVLCELEIQRWFHSPETTTP